MGGMVTEMGRCLILWESMPCLYANASATTQDWRAILERPPRGSSLDWSREMEKSCISDMKLSRLRLVSTPGDVTSELAVELRGLIDEVVGLRLFRLDLKGVKRRQKYVGDEDAEPGVEDPEVGEPEEELDVGVEGEEDVFCVDLRNMVLVERPFLRIRTAWQERCLL